MITRRWAKLVLCNMGFSLLSISGTQARGDLVTPIDGVSPSEFLGSAVAAIGDVNGDGFPDFAAGGPGWRNSASATVGRVVIYSGKNFLPLYQFEGSENGADFGLAIGGVGDLNADGFPDLAVGAPEQDAGGLNNSGHLRVFSGKTGAQILVVGGTSVGEWFGRAVVGGGDIDSDGFMDLAVGAPRNDTQGHDAGSVTIISGKAGTIFHTFFGPIADGEFGSAISNAGLIDGDASPDIIVGIPYMDTLTASNAGSATLLSCGKKLTLATFYGKNTNDYFGTAVSGVGDLDGDGTPDVLVGAPNADVGLTNNGQVVALSGKTGSSIYATSLSGSVSGVYFGMSISGLGDVNGDARPDFVVGSPGTTSSESVRRFSGKTGSEFLPADTGSSSEFGTAVAGVGDLDHDGYEDHVAGAPDWNGNGQTDSGRVRVLSGLILGPDLCLASSAPLQVPYEIGSAQPAPVALSVKNCGSIGTTVSYQVIEEPPVGFLSASPTSGSVSAGSVGSNVLVSFAVTGLAAGTYSTNLRFVNANSPEDFEIVPVTLTVQNAPAVADLCLSSTLPISAFWSGSGPLPANVVRVVSNCGATGTNLQYEVVELPGNVSWLAATPGSGFIAAGGSASISIQFTAAGLSSGLYQTVLRFRNVQQPSDFVDVSVSLSVGFAPFRAGDILTGTFSETTDSDTGVFEALAGAKLKISPLAIPGSSVRVMLRRMDGLVLEEKVVASGKKANLAIPEVGTYRLEVASAGGAIGSYSLKTSMKLPTEASSIEKKVKPAFGTTAAELPFSALSGAGIEIQLKKIKNSGSGLACSLVDPSGAMIDLTPFAGPGVNQFSSVSLGSLGEYRLIVSGFGSPTASAKVQLEITQPMSQNVIPIE